MSSVLRMRCLDACLVSAHHVCLWFAFLCISSPISAQGWKEIDFSAHVRRLLSSTTVSRGTKRCICTNQEEGHGYGRHLQLATHTRINRRCSASQTEPAESDSIPLCCPTALHP